MNETSVQIGCYRLFFNRLSNKKIITRGDVMVEPKDFLKDMVSFHKKSFEQSYTVMGGFRGESEKMVNSLLDQSFDATKNMYTQYLETFIVEKK